jgi:hypothetical protein
LWMGIRKTKVTLANLSTKMSTLKIRMQGCYSSLVMNMSRMAMKGRCPTLPKGNLCLKGSRFWLVAEDMAKSPSST